MRILIALLLVSVALAGCTEKSPDVQADDFEYEGELQADDETGVIRGVVVDPAVVPIAEATVTLRATGEETVTNEAGAFGFGGVEPGTHFLEVRKNGFNASQASVDVVAGEDEPPVLKVLLERSTEDLMYVQEDLFQGFLKCSLSYIALCGVAEEQTGDNFLKRIPLESDPQWIQMEAVWDSTQATGDAMNLQMSYGGAGPSETCCTNQGLSPLMVAANQSVIDEHGIGSSTDVVVRMFVWEIPGTGIDDHTGMCVPVVLTTYCQGPGAAIDQRFDVFTHIFYNYAPPEGWRFTDGSEVPAPPA